MTTTIEEESMATTTEKDETTVSINGGEAFPLDELHEHGDEIAEDAGLTRRQLSFDVGGREPNVASVKATVNLRIPRELRKGSQVIVSVATADGELLAQSPGKIIAVTFEDKFDSDGILVATERVHKVSI